MPFIVAIAVVVFKFYTALQPLFWLMVASKAINYALNSPRDEAVVYSGNSDYITNLKHRLKVLDLVVQKLVDLLSMTSINRHYALMALSGRTMPLLRQIGLDQKIKVPSGILLSAATCSLV